VGCVDHPGPLGLWQVCANGQGAATIFLDFVRAEDLERVLMVAINHWADRVKRKLGLHGWILSG
jgi:hypothetical protein